MGRALEWVKRHRGLVAVVVAVWVVLKAGRWVLGGAWTLREWIPWDDVWPWLQAHWVVGVLAAALLFAVAFAAVRVLIAVVARRSRRQPDEEPRPATRPTRAPHAQEGAAQAARPPAGGGLLPGDPLGARDDR